MGSFATRCQSDIISKSLRLQQRIGLVTQRDLIDVRGERRALRANYIQTSKQLASLLG